MGNVFDSTVITQGESELVDAFLETHQIITEDIVCYGETKPEVVSEVDGIKTVSISFETKWAAPWVGFTNAIKRYQGQLDFHMFWHDDDGGLGVDELFDDCVVGPGSFGEAYTKPLNRMVFTDYTADQTGTHSEDSWFREGQGKTGFIGLMADGEMHQYLQTRKEEILDEQALREVMRQQHPDVKIVGIIKDPRPDEVLHDGVVNRTQKLNEMILEVWGAEWFTQRGIAPGALTEKDLPREEYDRLITERYPICTLCRRPLPSRWTEGRYLCKCPPITEKPGEREKRDAKALAEHKARIETQSHESDDFFANLAKDDAQPGKDAV